MLGTRRNKHSNLILGFLFFLFCLVSIHAQEEQQPSIALVSYIKTLEERFNVKFSYINKDLEGLTIDAPQAPESLEDILSYIQEQFQIQYKKLNDRYYTLIKNSHVDLCGMVLDNFASNTIPGATVEILGTNRALITGDDGKFSIQDVPKDASIRIRYLGFLTQNMSVAEFLGLGECPKILMTPHMEQLNEVIVYQFLTTGIIKEKDASITLNTAEFGILPGQIEPDILQTVQALPGIKSIDETVSDINVRGGTNDQNLVLWNGIKMYQSGHFFGLISAFNPYLTDQVTIYKNGTPAAYGDGVSGVIQMETSNKIAEQWKGGAGFNLISGDFYTEVPLSDKLGIQFAARRSATDFLNSPTYNQFFDRAFQDSEITDQNNNSVDDEIQRKEDFFFYDFSGKILYNINDDHQLRFSAIHIKNNLKYAENNITDRETNISLLKQDNLSVGGQLQSQWNNRFSSHLNMYYSRYNLDAQNVFGN